MLIVRLLWQRGGGGISGVPTAGQGDRSCLGDHSVRLTKDQARRSNSATGTIGVPIGILAGYAMYPYLVGIVLMELAYRRWSNRQFRQSWKSQQNSVYIIVGVIVAARHEGRSKQGVVDRNSRTMVGKLEWLAGG